MKNPLFLLNFHRKEQDYTNLEEKFYETYTQLDVLKKERKDILESLRVSEENTRKLMVFRIKYHFFFFFSKIPNIFLIFFYNIRTFCLTTIRIIKEILVN